MFLVGNFFDAKKSSQTALRLNLAALGLIFVLNIGIIVYFKFFFVM